MSKVGVTVNGRLYEVDFSLNLEPDARFNVVVNDATLSVIVPGLDDPANEIEWIVVNDRPYELVIDRDLGWIESKGSCHRLEVHDLEAVVARPVSRDGRVKAPIPGLITRVLVAAGDRVEIGQPLLVLEAMKMENEIRASRSGVVHQLTVVPRQEVRLHEVLAEIAEEENAQL